MALTLKLIADSSAEDFHVMHGELRIGQIYKRKVSLRPDAQWLWALNGLPVSIDDLPLTGLSASLEEATIAIGERWRNWLAWARLKEEDRGFGGSEKVSCEFAQYKVGGRLQHDPLASE
jgi:hypothetical protein